MDKNAKIKFKNLHFSYSSNPIYSQVRCDSLSKSKIKSNGKVIAIPDINGSGIGILYNHSRLDDHGQNSNVGNEPADGTNYDENPITIRCNEHAPIVFSHGTKQLLDFEFSNPNDDLIASSSRNDNLLRIWSTPSSSQELLQLRDPKEQGKEFNTPMAFLSGHEKRIDLIHFHRKICNIVATASQDKTIRLWDIEAIHDSTIFQIPNDATALSLNFDLNSNMICVGSNDGMIHFYDPRSSDTSPIQSLFSDHSISRGMKVVSVLPDHYFISSGFLKNGASRSISIYDYRMNQSINSVTVEENGPSLLTPYTDKTFPLVYLVGNGEGVRIYEVVDGNLCLNSYPNFIDQFIDIDVLSNPVDEKKFEISKFLYISIENNIKAASLCAPGLQSRSNQDVTFDIYPLETENRSTTSSSSCLSAPSNPDQAKSATFEVTLPIIDPLNDTKLTTIPDTLDVGKLSKISPENILRGSIDEKDCEDKDFDTDYYSPLSIPVNPQYFGSHLALEQKSWFSTTWEIQWVVMRSTRLFRIVTKDDKLVPFAKYAQITKLKTFKISIDGKSRDVGFEFDYLGTTYRWKCDGNSERNEWISKLKAFIPGTSLSSKALPSLPCKQVTLMVDTIELADEENGNLIWKKKTMALDGESMIHFYPSDLQNFNPDTPAEECLDLSTAFSVRGWKDSSIPMLSVNTFKRAYHFKMKSDSNLDEWTSSITAVIPNFQSKTMVIEGPVRVKYEGGLQAEWLVFANSSLFYFSTRLSLKPLDIIDARKIRFFGENVDSYCTSEEPVFPPKPEIVISIDHSDETVHSFKTTSHYQFWVLSFDQIRRACWDLNARIGLDPKNIETLFDEFKEGTLADDITQYNEKFLNAGSTQYLFKIVKKSAVAVAPLISSLRIDKAYVLDCGVKIFIWTGESVSRVDRAVALNLALSLRKYRSSRPKLIIIDPDEDLELNSFLSHLGCTNPSQFLQLMKNGKKQRKISFSSKMIIENQEIYRNSASDPKKLEFVYQGDLPSKRILQEGCILRRKHEIFVWMGKNINREQKRRLLFTGSKMAQSLVTKYPFVFYNEEYQGRETAFFKTKFRDFLSDLPIDLPIDDAEGCNARDIPIEKINVQKLIEIPKEPEQQIFKNQLEVQVYLIKSFEKTPIPLSEYGLFASSESYAISATFVPVGKGQQKTCTVYFWQGSLSANIEKGTCSLLTMEFSKEMVTQAKQIRIEEGKEPIELSKLFNISCFVIPKKRIPRKPSESNPLLFEIRQIGQKPMCRAYQIDQIDLKVSRYPLVVISPSKSWIICDDDATQLEKAGALHVIKNYGAFENQHQYISIDVAAKYLREQTKLIGWKYEAMKHRHNIRLFSCSSATGNTQISEIDSFVQEDLNDEHVMILDTVLKIYLWIGTRSKPKDQLAAIKSMEEYKSLLGRPENCIIEATFPFHEPEDFTRYFHGWTCHKFPTEKRGLISKVRNASDVLNHPPEHIDRTKLEMYLSAQEFQETFRMSKTQYESLPCWKQEKLKIQSGFY